MYGFLRGLLQTLEEARRQGRPWVYADRGYFRATYGSDYSGYFRVTRGAWQHNGVGAYPVERLAALNLRFEPWQRNGEHILVCPPGDVFTQAVGKFSALEWTAHTLRLLSTVTKRPIILRHKAMAATRPLTLDLKGCHALVTYMSNSAVEAVLAGVPVFCTGNSAASLMGRANLLAIENPRYPTDEERVQWAAALAANQWTLEELRQGAANRVFQN